MNFLIILTFVVIGLYLVYIQRDSHGTEFKNLGSVFIGIGVFLAMMFLMVVLKPVFESEYYRGVEDGINGVITTQIDTISSEYTVFMDKDGNELHREQAD